MPAIHVRDRFVGCLLAGASGDALGWPVEFESLESIHHRFGAGGITRFAPARGGIGVVTDDTQMTLFTAEGLLAAVSRGAGADIRRYADYTSQAYVRWLLTQGDHPAPGIRVERTGWLWKRPQLHERRAPGNTCLSALGHLRTFGQPAANDSKGCGGVMRMAPAGLLAWHWRGERGADWAFELGAALAALTHGHPSGYLTGGALAVLVMHLVDGVSLPHALARAMQCLERRPSHEEALTALQSAVRLAASDTPREDAIRELGQGWIAEEALAIAVYAALVARDLEDGVVLAVNHGGDSDSTGAIAGNLLGAMHGSAGIPSEWSARVELRETIVEVAGDLVECATWPLDSNDARVLALREKYPAE